MAEYPIVTQCGVQYWPMRIGSTSCERCEWLDACSDVVVRHNGFAFCEDLIEADLLPVAVRSVVFANDNDMEVLCDAL